MIRTKTKGNVTFVFMWLSFIGYVLWTAYGLLKGDYVVAIGQGAGILAAGATLIYMFKYRKG